MIEQLIEALRAGGLEQLTWKDVADTIWLAGQIGDADLDSSTETAGAPEAFSPDKPAYLDRPTPATEPSGSFVGTPTSQAPSRPAVPSLPVNTEMQAGVYLPKPSGDAYPQGGLPFRAPGAPALPNALKIARALRPLLRRVPSPTRRVLDEEATAQQVAEQHIWMPVERPGPSRWFDLALVVDRSRSMAIWSRTVEEFRRLLERHGAFRDVRVWTLDTETHGEPLLYAGTESLTSRVRLSNSRELADPNRKRLVLVVTDCVARAWRNRAIDDLLAMWAKSVPVVVVHMLPQRLWRHTSRPPEAVMIRSPLPGLPNGSLLVQRGDSHWRIGDEAAAASGDDGDSSARIPIPVTTLEASWLAPWARMIRGTGTSWTQAAVIWVPDKGNTEFREDFLAVERLHALDATERIKHFETTASPTAFKLAGYLASVPLSLPVMRLVQKVMLPDSTQTHLAEIFLGGLLEQLSPQDGHSDPEKVEYGFVHGVREALIDTVLRTDTWRVIREVANYLQSRVGQPLDFDALLADPEQHFALTPESRPFANVTAKTLRRLGGQYRELANRLERASLVSSVTDPALATLRTRLRGRPLVVSAQLVSKRVDELVELREVSVALLRPALAPLSLVTEMPSSLFTISNDFEYAGSGTTHVTPQPSIDARREVLASAF